MDLARKEQLTLDHINSISSHDDEDAVVRKAILDRVSAHIDEQKAAIDAAVQARIDELTGG